MATSINSGQVDTADPVSQRLVVDMHEPIRMLDPDVSQFSTILMDSRLQDEKAESFKKEWLEDRLMPRVLSLGASATSSATTLTTGTGEAAYAKTGDIIRIPSTGEAVRVTASDASASLTVVRGLGSVTAASAASGGQGTLVIVGGSNGQGAGLPVRLITVQTHNYNYTQIVRNSYGFTRTAQQTKWYGGKKILEYEREKKATEHKADIENMLFFGARAYSANSDAGHPQGQSGGLIEYISTNRTDAAGTFDKAELQDFLTNGLQYGSQRKVLFCSPIVSQVFGEFLQDNWVQSPPGTKFFGASVNKVISAAFAGAEIPVIVKRQWGSMGTPSSTGGLYSSLAFLVDLDSVRLAPMQSSVRLQDRQANDIDGNSEEYLAELTLVVQQETHHSLLKNVTG
jgi:hypothetical protein